MGKKQKKDPRLVNNNEDIIQPISARPKVESTPFINPVRQRKDQRKEKRQLKKAKRLAFSQGKEVSLFMKKAFMS